MSAAFLHSVLVAVQVVNIPASRGRYRRHSKTDAHLSLHRLERTQHDHLLDGIRKEVPAGIPAEDAAADIL